MARGSLTPGQHRPARRRGAIAIALAIVIAAGLLSRRYPLPGLFAEHTGDALYSTAAFCLFAAVRPALATWVLAVAALTFAWLVEGSQRLDWAWLAELRSCRVGALLLGQGFSTVDLVAYALGALLGAGIDVTFLMPSTPPQERPDRLPRQSSGPRT